MSMNIEALVKKHIARNGAVVEILHDALTEQAEAFKGELQAYDGMVRELTKTAEDMRAAHAVPVVGEPAAWSQYAFSQNGLSSCAGSNSLVTGTSNTCSHNNCLVIGTQLTTTKHGQVLIGNKEVHQTGDISPEELSVFKDILLKTRYPAHSIPAAELATLREQVETHATELRAYEATVANQAERIRQLERLRKDAAKVLNSEQIRIAAVAAVRAVTGCPDIKGKDGAYLVDEIIARLLEMQNDAAIAAEGEK